MRAVQKISMASRFRSTLCFLSFALSFSHLKRDNLKLAARTTRECVISNQSSSKVDLGRLTETVLKLVPPNWELIQSVAQLIICSINSPSSTANNNFYFNRIRNAFYKKFYIIRNAGQIGDLENYYLFEHRGSVINKLSPKVSPYSITYGQNWQPIK